MNFNLYSKFLFVLSILFSFVKNIEAQTYCTPSFPGGVSAITKVQWGTMSNTSSGASLLGFEDFTANADTITGGDLVMAIEGLTNANATDSLYAYFDWKGDGSFADSIDSYFLGVVHNTGNTPAPFTVSLIIAAPADSLPQSAYSLRFRVMKKQGMAPSSCNASGIGQAEDYSILYLPGTKCDSLMNAGTLTLIPPSQNSACDINIVNIGYSTSYGMRWQWESSPFGVNLFQPIIGANFPNYYAPADVYSYKDYRVIATCTDTGSFIVSAPVSVNGPTLYYSSTLLCLGETLLVNFGDPSCVSTIVGPNNLSTTLSFSIPNISFANEGWYVRTTVMSQCVNTFIDSFYVDVSNCADSVWPGDANNDLIVDNADILQLGLAMGNTGYPRLIHDTAYYAQHAYDWATSYNGVNAKHADCDGNGTVLLTDTMAIHSHYGMPHPKTTPAPHAKVSSFPDLYFDIANAPIVTGQNTIPLMLGSATLPMNNFYGIAAKIKISGLTLNTQATVTPVSSWINFPLTFQRNVGNEQDDIALCKTDHQNSSGYGQLCLLHFNLPSGHSGDSIKLQLDDVRLVDASGNVLTDYNIIDLSAMIDDPTSVRSLSTLSYAAVIPNPSGRDATLQINTNEPASVHLTLADATGKQLWENTLPKAQGLQNVNLPGHPTPGMYFIRLDVDGARGQTLKWVKQQ